MSFGPQRGLLGFKIRHLGGGTKSGTPPNMNAKQKFNNLPIG